MKFRCISREAQVQLLPGGCGGQRGWCGARRGVGQPYRCCSQVSRAAGRVVEMVPTGLERALPCPLPHAELRGGREGGLGGGASPAVCLGASVCISPTGHVVPETDGSLSVQ